LTNVNSAAAIVVTLNSHPHQEDDMAAKTKPGKVRGAGHKSAAEQSGKRARTAAPGAGARENIFQVPDDGDDDIACRCIVQDAEGRSLPLYYDDFN
jgi:hypothetical protein